MRIGLTPPALRSGDPSLSGRRLDGMRHVGSVTVMTRRGVLGRPGRGRGKDRAHHDHQTSIAAHQDSFGSDIDSAADCSMSKCKYWTGRTAGQAAGNMRLRSIAAAFGLLWLGFAGSAEAAKTRVAVAANFTEPAREIAARFREKTSHEAVLIFSAYFR